MAEVEIKYLVHDAAFLDRLEKATAIGPFSVASRQAIEQTDEYWDTPDAAAARSKVSLRRRLTNGVRLHTVKIGAVATGFSRRTEIEEPAGDAGLVDWLERLCDEDRLELPFATADLAPMLSVHNLRSALQLQHPNGTEVELALDRVTFSGPRGEASELEIEGELVSGSESTLLELRDWLEAQGELTASHGSKYERARELVG